MKLSYRNKIAGLETSSFGVKISTSARIAFRKYYSSWGMNNVASMRNADLNDVIASDFLNAEPQHRFRLRSGEIAEIRKSPKSQWYYVAKMESAGYSIIIIQHSYKEPPPEIRKHRLEKWVNTQSGTAKGSAIVSNISKRAGDVKTLYGIGKDLDGMLRQLPGFIDHYGTYEGLYDKIVYRGKFDLDNDIEIFWQYVFEPKATIENDETGERFDARNIYSIIMEFTRKSKGANDFGYFIYDQPFTNPYEAFKELKNSIYDKVWIAEEIREIEEHYKDNLPSQTKEKKETLPNDWTAEIIPFPKPESTKND